MNTQDRPFISTKSWLGLVVRTALFPIAILWPAGTWLWWEAWAAIAIWITFLIALTVFLLRKDPALLVERMKASPVQKGQKGWDRVVMSLMLIVAIAYYTVPGFDVVRFGWSQPLPVWVQIAALLVHIPCFVFLGWVMSKNTFLAPVVKIAHEREHRVVTDGPYAIVRHPMYSAVIVLVFAFPIALGSRYGLIPGFFIALLLVVRTVLEDRTLHAELPGYREYASITHYRLIPRIW